MEELNIELKYFNTLGHNYQWFLLYEFLILDSDLFTKPDAEILNEILLTRILDQQLYHSEMDGVELELSGLKGNTGRPYKFANIETEDFNHLTSKDEFNAWLRRFRTEDWEDDREDAQFLIDKAEKELRSKTGLTNGVWHLSKEDFDDDSIKLIETHWIYLHFETFIEVDRVNSMIRTFDFGYD